MDEIEQKEEEISSEQIIETDVEHTKTCQYKTNSWFFNVLLVFSVIYFGMFYLCRVYLTAIPVKGISMQPTINASVLNNDDEVHNDTVLFRKSSSYTHNNIVIISNLQEQYLKNTNPEESVDYLIKRIVACPGDTITFFLTNVDGFKLYYDFEVTNSNGQKIELNDDSHTLEPMYFYKNASYGEYFNNILANLKNPLLPLEDRRTSIKIEPNCYFVMGDNRNNSTDSRYFGCVKYEDIAGNVKLQIKYQGNIWTALFGKLKESLSVN